MVKSDNARTINLNVGGQVRHVRVPTPYSSQILYYTHNLADDMPSWRLYSSVSPTSCSCVLSERLASDTQRLVTFPVTCAGLREIHPFNHEFEFPVMELQLRDRLGSVGWVCRVSAQQWTPFAVTPTACLQPCLAVHALYTNGYQIHNQESNSTFSKPYNCIQLSHVMPKNPRNMLRFAYFGVTQWKCVPVLMKTLPLLESLYPS